jgi:Uma2 family endonuclease
MAPDLAAEVLSPGDRAADVADKVRDWLAAGTRVSVHRNGRSVMALAPGDLLDGEDVLPGLALPVSEVFRL